MISSDNTPPREREAAGRRVERWRSCVGWCQSARTRPAPDLGKHDFGQRGAYWGMTLRDYFAAKAMQGMVAAEYAGTYRSAVWANDAYEVADAMLKAREVQNGERK